MIDPISLVASVASLLGLSAKPLLDKVHHRLTDRSNDRMRQQRASVRHYMLVEVLKHYYELSRGPTNRRGAFLHYAVEVDECPQKPSVLTSMAVKSDCVGLELNFSDLKCVLTKATPDHTKFFASDQNRTEPLRVQHEELGIKTPNVSEDRIADYLALLASSGAKVWDADIYRLLDSNNFPSSLVFGVDRFHGYRHGAGLLMEELALALIEANFDATQVVGRREGSLPLRGFFLPNEVRFEDYESRVCAGGVEVTLAMADGEGGFILPIQQRSEEVGENQGLFAVIPTAFHQPMVDDSAEVSPLSSVYRELFEELFKGEEIEKNVTHVKSDWYFEHPALHWLKSNKRDVSIACTSFGLNLMAGNYDLGVLVIVHAPTFWRRFGGEMEHNWEARRVRTITTRSQGDLDSLSDLVTNRPWADSALLSLVEGLTLLKAREPKRVANLNFRRLLY